MIAKSDVFYECVGTLDSERPIGAGVPVFLRTCARVAALPLGFPCDDSDCFAPLSCE